MNLDLALWLVTVIAFFYSLRRLPRWRDEYRRPEPTVLDSAWVVRALRDERARDS